MRRISWIFLLFVDVLFSERNDVIFSIYRRARYQVYNFFMKLQLKLDFFWTLETDAGS
jgi:hypothetical protein